MKLGPALSAFSRMALLHDLLLLYGRRSLRIAYYHLVADKSPPYYQQENLTTPAVFRRQIRWLKKRYEFISLEESVKIAREGGDLDRKIVLTTDDGFRENYEVIAPILSDEKIPAVFFLLGTCIDNAELMWRNKIFSVVNTVGKEQIAKLIPDFCTKHGLQEPSGKTGILKWSLGWDMAKKESLAQSLWEMAGLNPLSEFLHEHKPYMNPQQIKELIGSGFEIGAHTMTHPDCRKLNQQELEEEVFTCADILKDRFGKPVRFFAYPYGLRPEPAAERIMLGKRPFDAMLGIRNRLANFANPSRWERDSMEKSFEESVARFVILPIIRQFLPRNI